MLKKIIEAIIEFFVDLFGSPSSSITVIETLSLGYLKSFRTGQNTEIIVIKYDNFKENAMLNFKENAMLKEFKKINIDAKYIIAEYDPISEEILRIEGAKAADNKIQAAVENAKNGVLVIDWNRRWQCEDLRFIQKSGSFRNH